MAQTPSWTTAADKTFQLGDKTVVITELPPFNVNAQPADNIVARMLELDAELWKRTPTYDREKNRRAMEHNAAAREAQGLDPYYRSEWHHDSCEGDTDDDGDAS